MNFLNLYTDILVELEKISAIIYLQGFPGGSDGEETMYNAGDIGLIPGLGKSSGKGNDYVYSTLSFLLLWGL